MSMKRLAILAAVGQGTLNGTSFTLTGTNMTAGGSGGSSSGSGRVGGASLHGNVNVLLGGAMLSGVILVVFLICYCCHRNMRKHAPQYSGYWRDPELPMEVYTLAGQQQCYESAGLFLSETPCQELVRPPTPGPPPAYETVVQEKDKLAAELEAVVTSTDKASMPSTPQPNDDSGLPSYEAALRIEAGGYV